MTPRLLLIGFTATLITGSVVGQQVDSITLSKFQKGESIDISNKTFDHDILVFGQTSEDQVVFDNANFNQRAAFRDLSLRDDMSFDNAVFSNYAAFSDLNFENDKAHITFNQTTLPDTIIFDYNKSIPIVDFTSAIDDNKTHYISLYFTDISKLRLDYDHFKLIWINYAGAALDALQQREPVYEALLNNFKNNGQTESYKKLDIEYIDYRLRYKNLGLISTISRMWWNYGFNKERILWWTPTLLLILTLVTFPLIDRLNPHVYQIESIARPLPIKGEKYWISFWAVLRRFWFSLVYTAGIFFRLTLKTENLNLSKGGAVYIILINVLGTVCLAYLAAFVLQK